MRAIIITIVSAAWIMLGIDAPADANSPSKDLVLMGKVTSLKLGGDDEFKRWIVTAKVR
jgi:hypothetical protein